MRNRKNRLRQDWNAPDQAGSERGGARALLSSESGAALILAMMTVIVMTLLGMVLLDVLRNSNIQVAATEKNIQAEMLAQKGLDETLATIREAVDDANQTALGDSDVPVINRIHRVADNLGRLMDGWGDHDVNVPALNGHYSIEIDWNKAFQSTHDFINDENAVPLSPYTWKVNVKSTGTIDGGGVQKPVTKEMEVYVSTINPVFRYPVSSVGNLTMNGYSYVVGDVLSRSGQFAYSNEALFIGEPDSLFGVVTNKPAIKGFIYAPQGYAVRPVISASDPWGTVPASPGAPWSTAPFSDGYYPFEDKSLTPDEDIDVASYVSHYTSKLDAIAADHSTYYNLLPGVGDELDGLSLSGTLTGNQIADKQWPIVKNGLNVKKSATAGDLGNLAIIGGALTVLPDSRPTLDLTGGGSLYIRFEDPDLVAADLSGTLKMNYRSQAVIEGDVVLNNGFWMSGGNMYVKGNLKIIGDVNIDGSIYVDGTVELKDVYSLNADTDHPVIIAASGQFDFSDNLTSDRSMRAFFYSQANMNLYGIKNKIYIKGGIHGSQVTMNAVGQDPHDTTTTFPKTTYAGSSSDPLVSDIPFTPNQSSLPPSMSNLIVIYDDDLYDIPPHISIPTTDTLNIYVKKITYDAAH